MTASHPARVCPFCGVAADAPHKTQEGCIEALQAEIAHMRDILQHVKGPDLAAQADRTGLNLPSDREL